MQMIRRQLEGRQALLRRNGQRYKGEVRERRYLKRMTARWVRRQANRDPETPFGLDCRSTVLDWQY
jgi:hypothetical protein